MATDHAKSRRRVKRRGRRRIHLFLPGAAIWVPSLPNDAKEREKDLRPLWSPSPPLPPMGLTPIETQMPQTVHLKGRLMLLKYKLFQLLEFPSFDLLVYRFAVLNSKFFYLLTFCFFIFFSFMTILVMPLHHSPSIKNFKHIPPPLFLTTPFPSPSLRKFAKGRRIERG